MEQALRAGEACTEFLSMDLANMSVLEIEAARSQAVKDMNEAIGRRVADVMAQREEVLMAFIAKYGFEPDRFVQIADGSEWSVRRRSDEEMEVFKRRAR